MIAVIAPFDSLAIAYAKYTIAKNILTLKSPETN